MLLFAIDLIVFLSLAAQFAIAGYFLYLVYWLIELPAADSVPPPLPIWVTLPISTARSNRPSARRDSRASSTR